jgi:hypothetical protein
LDTLFGMIPDTYALPRRSERKPIRKAVVLVVESDGPDTLYEGTTVDLSEFGARVETESPLAPGQTITLLQPEDPPTAYRCMVVWSGDVASDGQGQVGLEFLNTLPPTLEN